MSIFTPSEEKKALCDFYRAMTNTVAWNDLKQWVDKQLLASMDRMDSKSASSLTLIDVGEERGIRKGMLKLIHYAEQKAEGI